MIKFILNNPWSVEKLFQEYIDKFKNPIQLTRHIQGPIRQIKQFETLTDHFKDCTFKPKISSMSIEIEKRKRLEVKQKASELCESSNQENPFQTQQQNNSNSSLKSIKPFARKFSVNNTKSSKLNDNGGLNKWVNRSLDQSAHDRLYNEAKFQKARLEDRIQRSFKLLKLCPVNNRDPVVDGCTFQPKLVTNAYITKKMIEGRVKSVESRNQKYQKAYQMVGTKPAKTINQDAPQVTKGTSSKPQCKEPKEKPKQPEMVNHLKRLREKEAAKRNKSKYTDENANCNKASKISDQSLQESNFDYGRIPLGVIQETSSANSSCKNKELDIIK